MKGRQSYGLTEAERLLLFKQRQEEQLNQIKKLLPTAKKNIQDSEYLEDIFIDAVTEKYLENIKYLINNDVQFSANTYKKSIKIAVQKEHRGIIRYLFNNDKITIPYVYLAESMGKALERYEFDLARKIVALCSLKDLNHAAKIYSQTDESEEIKYDSSDEDHKRREDLGAQRFYATDINTPEKVLCLKIDNILEQIKEIKIMPSIIKQFVPNFEKILDKIVYFSEKFKNRNAISYKLDNLLTEINRLLFKIDIENLQSLKARTENQIFSPKNSSIVEERLENKELTTIFNALEEKANKLEEEINEISTLPLNSIQSRTDPDIRTLYMFNSDVFKDNESMFFKLCRML